MQVLFVHGITGRCSRYFCWSTMHGARVTACTGFDDWASPAGGVCKISDTKSVLPQPTVADSLTSPCVQSHLSFRFSSNLELLKPNSSVIFCFIKT